MHKDCFEAETASKPGCSARKRAFNGLRNSKGFTATDSYFLAPPGATVTTANAI
jgi:hypothetical protein